MNGFRKGWDSTKRIPPSIVILRQRSLSRSEGLPTKDLCTRSQITLDIGLCSIWVAQRFSAAILSLGSIYGIAESHTINSQALLIVSSVTSHLTMACCNQIEKTPAMPRGGSQVAGEQGQRQGLREARQLPSPDDRLNNLSAGRKNLHSAGIPVVLHEAFLVEVSYGSHEVLLVLVLDPTQ